MSSNHRIRYPADQDLSPVSKQPWWRVRVIVTIVVGLLAYWFPAGAESRAHQERVNAARAQVTQKPKKTFTLEEVAPPERKREIIAAGDITFHTNANPKHKETIVEVSVIDKSGRTIASLPGGVRALSARSNSGLLILKVLADYDWEGAKGATCKLSIKNLAGVTRNDHWSFGYEIVLWSSDLDALACSGSKVDLYSAPNKKIENSESTESILKEY